MEHASALNTAQCSARQFRLSHATAPYYAAQQKRSTAPTAENLGGSLLSLEGKNDGLWVPSDKGLFVEAEKVLGPL